MKNKGLKIQRNESGGRCQCGQNGKCPHKHIYLLAMTERGVLAFGSRISSLKKIVDSKCTT